MIKEATITLPKFNHEGVLMRDIHMWLRNILLSEFGGYTATKAVGVWQDSEGNKYNDVVYRYIIGMPVSAKSNQTLTKIADGLLSQTDQHCIYYTKPNGECVFHERKQDV